MITFTCKAAGPVPMLDAHAARLLAIVGKSAAGPGILTPEQIPGALAQLRAAASQEVKRGDEPRPDADDDVAEVDVGLARRAFPLVDMLERARAAGEPVLWSR